MSVKKFKVRITNPRLSTIARIPSRAMWYLGNNGFNNLEIDMWRSGEYLLHRAATSSLFNDRTGTLRKHIPDKDNLQVISTTMYGGHPMWIVRARAPVKVPYSDWVHGGVYIPNEAESWERPEFWGDPRYIFPRRRRALRFFSPTTGRKVFRKYVRKVSREPRPFLVWAAETYWKGVRRYIWYGIKRNASYAFDPGYARRKGREIVTWRASRL